MRALGLTVLCSNDAEPAANGKIDRAIRRVLHCHIGSYIRFSFRILLDQNVDHISFRPELLRPSHEEFAVICCAVERSVHQFRDTVFYPLLLVRCEIDEAL